MIARTVPLGVAFLLLVAATPAQDAKKELEALQGEWTMFALEQRGEKKDALKATLTIKGEQWILNSSEGKGGGGVDTTFKIDPSKNPKTIDLTFKLGEKENRSLGIYKLEDDLLTMCRTTGGADRPKEFKTTEDAGILVVWKRAKK
jgi:uncharacterized protein (TIGR03067 family)